MRILLCTVDGGGNVPPLVAIASELVRRRYKVRVLAGPYYRGGPRSESLEASFTASGCEVVAPDQQVWLEDIPTEIIDLNTIPDHLPIVRGFALWTPLSVPWAIQATKQIESFNPDVAIVDLLTPGAAVAAEAAGLPYVEMQTSVPVHRLLPGLPVPGRGAPPGEDEPARKEEFLRFAEGVTLPYINDARARFGLSPDTDPWAWEDRAARFLVPSSPEIDFPADSYPSNYVYTGTVRPAAANDGWDNPWDAADQRPLIVASSTTTRLGGLWYAVFQATANAVIELNMRGLLTHGPMFDPQALPQAENLAYRTFVPHSTVLPAAAAMVSQCGHGATVAALRFGVPMVCVPVFADQPDLAARIVHHGAGLRLSTTSAEAEFREAIATVVRDPQYREAARALGRALANEDGASRAADEIESVTKTL